MLGIDEKELEVLRESVLWSYRESDERGVVGNDVG